MSLQTADKCKCRSSRNGGLALRNLERSIGPVRDYKDLLVWQRAMKLAELIYRLTRVFPGEEKFGLTSQMRRAAVSIPSNLAEGQARNTTGEFILFISHASGSLAELDTQLRLSLALRLCCENETQEIAALVTELQKMLNGLRCKLRANPRSGVRGNREALTTNH
jgi:four helix bundle protein